jgi:hypothetical protein
MAAVATAVVVTADNKEVKMGTNTNNNLFYKPALDETGWNTTTNANWDAADTAIHTLQTTPSGTTLDVGVIVYSKVAPTTGTWLACDGTAISQATYSALFTKIGHLTTAPSFTQLPMALNTQVAIAYGNGIYVRGSTTGLESSTDLITWTLRATPCASGASIFVYYLNSLFFAADSNGILLTSSDAITWTAKTTGLIGIFTVSYGNGLYIAAGSNGALVTSTDATTWTTRTTGFGATIIRCSVYYATASLFVIAGDSGKVATSPDGIIWTLRTSNIATTLQAIALSSTEIVIAGSVGGVITSSNGTTWTKIAGLPALAFTTLIYSGGTYVMAGQTNYVALSTDGGATWTQKASLVATAGNIGTYDGTNFIVVGGANSIMYSSNGVLWKSKTVPTATALGLEYVNSLFVALLAGGMLATSPDGVEWTARGGGSTLYTGVAYDGTSTMILGQAATATTYLSTDGLATLAGHATGVTGTTGPVAYGNGLFLATSTFNGGLSTSPDGITWTYRGFVFANSVPTRILYANSLFVALAANKIFTSTDGINWIPVTQSVYGSATYNSIAYGNGKWVVSGSTGTSLLTSTDGTTWTTQYSLYSFVSLMFANSTFYGVTTTGIFLVSTDGVNWTSIYTLLYNVAPITMTYGNGKFIGVGTTTYVIGTEFAYNRSTQFRTPKITTVDGVRAWIKA